MLEQYHTPFEMGNKEYYLDTTGKYVEMNVKNLFMSKNILATPSKFLHRRV